MRRTLTLILGVALFGILAAVVVASQGADDPASTETVTDTVERTTTVDDNPKRDRADDDAQNGVDISGPCDEAEHAGDPRCGGQAPANQAPAQGGVDISGPCDEAEHAGDPRCTGAGGDREDNSGPGSSHSGGGDDDSSGPGGGGNSGPGGGGDDD
jgi:hypothetical protein